MSLTEMAGWVFVLLAMVVCLFHLSIVFGAPWGEYTMGGQIKGKLPASRRIAAVIQAFLMGYFAFVVAENSGIVNFESGVFQVNLWILVAFFALGTIANLITPSKRERRLWAPVTVVMLLSTIYLALD